VGDPSQVITAVATLVAALTGLLGAAVAAVVTLRRKPNGNGKPNGKAAG